MSQPEAITLKQIREARAKGKCRGLKVVKVSKNCAIYVNWPTSVSICCVFER